jgi:nucleoside-diphosphate-sugar epimerase
MIFLITGGNGFIGSNAVNYLISQGHSVIVIDNLSSDAHDQFYYNDKATYYQYNITDYEMCSDVFNRHQPDYVLHFAAEARIQNCIEDPIKAYESNVIGTLTMLQLSKKYKVKRFVLSSTSAIYGLKNEGFLDEQMNPDCLNAYSLTKLAAEQACKLYSDLYDLSTVCLRYFNVYGPNQPKRGSYAPVIGIFSRQIKNNEPMTIVGDGLQSRDYIHVSDIVTANILAATSAETLKGDIFNVGTGVKYSVLEVAKNMGTEYTYLPPRSGEARHTLANNAKIQSVLGWKPTKCLIKYLENKEYVS